MRFLRFFLQHTRKFAIILLQFWQRFRPEPPFGGDSSPPFLLSAMARQKGELSIFVDESGSFDSLVFPSRFYLVTCVFHNQKASIGQQLADLESQLTVLGFQNAYLHAGPLIRREEAFRHMDLVQRRKLFSRMVAFTRKCPISYKVFSVDKKFYSNPESIRQNLLEQIVSFLSSDGKWIEEFQKVKSTTITDSNR